MEKKADSQFTSTFWRQIHQEYFMVETPVSLDNMIKYYQPIQNNFNQEAQELIHQVLKLQRKNKSKTEKINDLNLIRRLNLILMQRKQSSEPIQQLIEDMIDKVCEDKLIDELDQCQNLIRNIHLQPIEKQINIYYEEEEKLKSLHSLIDWPDQINQVIMELENDLISVQQKNRLTIQNMQTHLQEINNTLKFRYSIQQIGEFKLKISRNHIQHHQEELTNLYNLIIMYEDYQVAESIGRVIYNQNDTNITVIFDKYLSFNPVELSLEQFESLQRLREMRIILSEQDQELNVNQQLQDFEMCHYCRQMIEKHQQKQCTYNHVNMNLHQYNDELLTQQRYSISNKNMQKFYQDLYSANYIIEDNLILCQKYFCFKCLKYEFDDYDISENEWICPMCKGLCLCIRCQRNDGIYKLKRNLIEINGDLDLLYDKSLFENLVCNKRKLIQNIPLDYINNQKVNSETEEIFSSKNCNKEKIYINKSIKKKKNSDTILVLPKYIHNIDNQQQSTKIKIQKKFRRLIPNDRVIEDII